MLVGVSFAQKKAVKEAKKAFESDKLTDARDFIKPALADIETKDNPETWKLAGDIENKIFDGERAKQALRQSFNEETMYVSLYNTYQPYVTTDSLGQLPDKKGKVKNKYRKDIAAIMKANYLYFINGGVYFNNLKKPEIAVNYFEKFWDIPNLSLFDELLPEEKLKTENDTTYQIVKYYAFLCAKEAGQSDRAIGYLKRILAEPFFENNGTYTKQNVYELMANQYLVEGDSAKFIKVLEDGAEKYPKSNYFMTNLVNIMIRNKESDKALSYLDQAIKNDPNNACQFFSVKANIYTDQAKYDEAFKTYEDALKADDGCERALEGLAISYILKAQDIKEVASKAKTRKEQSDLDAEAAEFYKKALPLLLKFKEVLKGRDANSSDIKQTVYKLRNVYYNLNMNAEYEAAEKEYEAM
ncbi:hypothetical protein D0T53_02525 [Dysgonomonas sp. 216]|nr:hypothetical protein [Dysgonomonas sp. 216]